MFRNKNFDKLLDKATSHLLIDPDYALIINLCDLIRQQDVQPKVALAAVKKKLFSPNPHTVLFALNVLESFVKNCGTAVHEELGSKAYCDSLYELAKTTTSEQVRNRLLELLQTWSFAFRKNPKQTALKDLITTMKQEGYKFPAIQESDAMFSADSAPDWTDGEVCNRCRVNFSLLVRKHHCRACGHIFCAQCSGKTMTLPKYGIEKEVRVCDNCYETESRPSTSKNLEKQDSELPPEYLNSPLSQQPQVPPQKSEDELTKLTEEEQMNLVLALSLSEIEAEKKNKKSSVTSYNTVKESRLTQQSPTTQIEEETNPELAKYLNRSYWESRAPQKSAENVRPTSPSAPSANTIPLQGYDVKYKAKENGEMDSDLEEFINTLRSQVDVFINRMKSNSSRGRSITNDTSVQSLFMNITAMHSKLLNYIQQHDDSRLHFERLQDKLTQVKDARAALDALREEHREKLRREAEEAERQRQLQMAHKLDIMRKKKQEYLQYQRQLALQRVQEQEREMQMRQEQQKQQYLMGPQMMNMGYMVANVHAPQYPAPNSAPPVTGYHQYGPPPQQMMQKGMAPGQVPPQSAPPQMPHVSGPIPTNNMMSLPHQQMNLPPGFVPIPNQGGPNIGPLHLPPHQGGQQIPQHQPSINAPSQAQLNHQSFASHGMPSNTLMGMVQSQPNRGMPQGQNMMPPNQGIPPQQYQQPGAPPASPQISQQISHPSHLPQKNGETETAELISFD